MNDTDQNLKVLNFIKEYENSTSEQADKHLFWKDFFAIFGIDGRRLYTYEAKVELENDKKGYIDLFWKGMLIVEHKSAGQSLDKAFNQAIGYTYGIKQDDLPKYIIVCDFKNFRVYDLDNNTDTRFTLQELDKHLDSFGFIAGFETKFREEEEKINIKATDLMAELHVRLKDRDYKGIELEQYLVRLLFCFFAEDTGIFGKNQFTSFLESTKVDGSDLGRSLGHLFKILNTEDSKRQQGEPLNAFVYVNGSLFGNDLNFPVFDNLMRETLLDCTKFDWSMISPVIFGSMFQSVMVGNYRRSMGAHYTSEENIHKVIDDLFLNDLKRELNSLNSEKKLITFHKKIYSLKFLDPACGCGNFLIVTYKALRDLELSVLNKLKKTRGATYFINPDEEVKVSVNQFYGIEIDQFACKIAEVAMWLTDHQCNMQVNKAFSVSEEFKEYYNRIPLKEIANITHGNSLYLEWGGNIDFIMGNPPFIGSNLMSDKQRGDKHFIFNDLKSSGALDYVSCWYAKASNYIQNNEKVRCAFVSTNSICQGRQPAILWQYLWQKNIKIDFAHQSFKWGNEAGNNAGVYCVIIGFSHDSIKIDKKIYTYIDTKVVDKIIEVSNINSYLVDGDNVVIEERSKSICENAPKIVFGSMPNDGGYLLLTKEEKDLLIREEPKAEKWLKNFTGAEEYIKDIKRYCLWLVDIEPNELTSMPKVLKRVKQVEKTRELSTRDSTKKLANKPWLFGEIRVSKGNYIVIPSTSGHNRNYIPIGFLDSKTIASNACHIIPDATLYHFAILTSKMHMAWVSATCGRLGVGFRYSANSVYHNYPWAETPSGKDILKIENLAQNILNTRANHPNSSLEDLYKKGTMPIDLRKAHDELDKAIDKLYGFKGDERERLAFLFKLYKKYTERGILLKNNSKKIIKKRVKKN